jgi:hypothetical protein
MLRARLFLIALVNTGLRSWVVLIALAAGLAATGAQATVSVKPQPQSIEQPEKPVPVAPPTPDARPVPGGKPLIVSDTGAGPPLTNLPLDTAPMPAADPAISDRLRDITRGGDIQTAWPTQPPPPPPRQQSNRQPNGFDDFMNWLAGGGQWLVQLLAWLLVAAVAILILYLTVPTVREWIDMIIRRKKREPAGDDGEQDDGWRPDMAGARNLLREADALAEAGKFDEAVHLLLERSLQDIAKKRPGTLKPAQTARAIARLEALPVPAQQALSTIVALVERSLWAAQPIGHSEWQQARTAYEQFAFGDHWRASQPFANAPSDWPPQMATAA